MRSKLLISGLALVVGLAVAVTGLDAQTIRESFNKVFVDSTITAGGVISVTGDTGLAPAGAGFQFASFASPNIGRVFIGDGTGYRMHISTRTGGVTTDRITFFDNGNLSTTGGITASGASTFPGGFSTPVLVPDGTVSAPGFGFASAPTTGLYRGGLGQLAFAHNGVLAATLSKDSFGGFEFSPRGGAFGTGSVTGSYVSVGNNNSGNGAAGFVEFTDRVGGLRSVWLNSGLLRIASGRPTENDSTSHTGGSVIGDQTSTAESKHLMGLASTRDMLNAVLKTRVHQFKYRDGRYGGETFTGIVTDESPWFGKDRDASHPQGKALNEINGLGYTVGAIQALHADTVKFRDDQLKLTRLLAEEQTVAARLTREAIQLFLERSNDIERRLVALEGRRR